MVPLEDLLLHAKLLLLILAMLLWATASVGVADIWNRGRWKPMLLRSAAVLAAIGFIIPSGGRDALSWGVIVASSAALGTTFLLEGRAVAWLGFLGFLGLLAMDVRSTWLAEGSHEAWVKVGWVAGSAAVVFIVGGLAELIVRQPKKKRGSGSHA